MTPHPLNYKAADMMPALSDTEVTNHYDVHTAKYFSTVSELVKGTVYEHKTLDELITTKYLNQAHSVLFHAVCQAWNHNFYWQSICPVDAVISPPKDIAAAISHTFGDIAELHQLIIDRGAAFFGSGWIWLTHFNNKLHVVVTPNGSRIIDGTPLWCCDLWEHAYLYDDRYVGDRKKYLTNIVKQINWSFVGEQYANC